MIGVVGYLCADLAPAFNSSAFQFTPGMLLEVGPLGVSAGGAVGNTGGALARLGVPVRLRGAVGDDLFGDAVAGILRGYGAHAQTMLQVIPGEHTAYAMVLNPPGSDRMFLAYRGVSDRLTAAMFDAEFRRGLAILHFGYPPLCEAMSCNDGAELRKLFAVSRREGILSSLDLSLPAPGSPVYARDWVAFLRNILPETDLISPSLDELKFMLKTSEESPEVLTDALLALGARAVFLKLGKRGAFFRTADTPETERTLAKFGAPGWRNRRCFIAPRPVEPVGTTGAGDAAIAGLLTGIYQGKEAADAAEQAVRVAEQVIAGANGKR